MSRSFVVDLIDTPTTQGHPLGLIYVEPAGFWDRGEDTTTPAAAAADQGDREFVYIHVVTDALVQGNVIRRAAGANTFLNCRRVDGVGISTHRIPGIAQWAFTAGDYGFVMRRGLGGALSDAATTADTPLMGDNTSGTTGRVRDLGTTNEEGQIALGLDAAAGAAEVIDAWIHCLGA
jgi:hypothetical protein